MPDSSRPATLAFAGRLEVIGLPEVLQILSQARRSGLLQLDREEPFERGEIELADGRVIRAEVCHLPERLGAVLLRRGLIHPDLLAEALRRQSAGYAWQPLGDVLLAMGAVDPWALAEALTAQIEEQMAVLLRWERGVFRFRLSTAAEQRPASRVSVALEPQQLLIGAAQRSDEALRVH